jgi:ATP-dependent Clp protease ATP-binding subunit ClpB
LTEVVRRKPYCVILLDEIEKAHPDVFNVLLQVLDDGRLTDGQGRTVDFKNVVLIMTSNIGSQMILDPNMTDPEKEKAVNLALRQHFRPEFLNRIDEVVIYKSLGESQIAGIVKVQLQIVMERLKQKKIQLEVSDEAVEYLAKKGFDSVYGARPLKRVIQNELLNPLAKLMISGPVEKCTVGVANNTVGGNSIPMGLTLQVLGQG